MCVLLALFLHEHCVLPWQLIKTKLTRIEQVNVYSRLRFGYQCLNDDRLVSPGMCQVLCPRDEAPLLTHQLRAFGYRCCGGGADDGPCHCSFDVAASPSPSLYCDGYLQLNFRILSVSGIHHRCHKQYARVRRIRMKTMSVRAYLYAQH